MRRFMLFLLVALNAPSYGAAAEVIHVATDRPLAYLKPLIEQYEAVAKIKIEWHDHGERLLGWLKDNPQKADLIITKDILVLESAKREGLLRPFVSKVIDSNVISTYREPQNLYLSLTYYARVIVYHKKKVKPDELSTYFDLAEPKWRGKICLGSGYNEENLRLFTQYAADNGLVKLKELLLGLKSNLVELPKGTDLEQLEKIFKGKCLVTFANSYALALLRDKPAKHSFTQSLEIFFPNQNYGGAYVISSGAALTSAIKKESLVEADRRAEATAFLEFLSLAPAQSALSRHTYEYPVNPEATPQKVLTLFGKGQNEVRQGIFEKSIVPLGTLFDLKEEVLKLLDEINFDGKIG